MIGRYKDYITLTLFTRKATMGIEINYNMKKRVYKPYSFRTDARFCKGWNAISRRVRKREPVCNICKKLSQAVDHIDGDRKNNNEKNLMGICRDCNTAKYHKVDSKMYIQHIVDRHSMLHLCKVLGIKYDINEVDQCDNELKALRILFIRYLLLPC